MTLKKIEENKMKWVNAFHDENAGAVLATDTDESREWQAQKIFFY